MLKTLGVQLRASMPVPSKGEVLSPEGIRATTGWVAFLPHPFRFSDTSVNNPSIVGSASHCNRSSPLHKGAKGDSALPTIPKPHYPSKSTISLPPLSKVRCCRPKEFGRLPEGLPQLHRTSPSPQPLQKDNSTLLRTTFLPYERSVGFASLRNLGVQLRASMPVPSKGEVLSPERIRATTGGVAFLPHPFRFSGTSVNNPSVTVTENTILCQRIFNFYKKQY